MISASDTSVVRQAERYLLTPPIPCTVGPDDAAVLCNISVRGARIEHRVRLRQGQAIQLKVKFDVHALTLSLPGKIVWSELVHVPCEDNERTYVSGIDFERSVEALQTVLQRLCARRGAYKMDDIRLEERYLLTRGTAGIFTPVGAIELLDLSAHGVKIRSRELVRLGTRGTVRIDVGGASHSSEAVVAWSRVAPREEHEAPAFVAGLSLVGAGDFTPLIADLCRAGVARLDAKSVENQRAVVLRRARLKPRSAAPLVAPDAVLLIQHAQTRLAASPELRTAALDRVRAAADPDVVNLLVSDSPYRDEILAIWEYLERRVELRQVETVLGSHRNQIAAS